jgi:hypothetical protein
MRTTIERKKARLRMILIAALALGTSSATLGGTLTALMVDQAPQSGPAA